VNWQTVATLMLGFLTAAGLEWFRDWRAIKREEATRRTQEIKDKADSKATFQRASILDLQEALLSFVQATRELKVRGFGESAPSVVPPELMTRISVAQNKVMALRARIFDDDLRRLAELCFNLATVSLTAKTNDEFTLRNDKVVDSLADVNERMTALLRELY
jgi:hypothetical protein